MLQKTMISEKIYSLDSEGFIDLIHVEIGIPFEIETMKGTWGCHLLLKTDKEGAIYNGPPIMNISPLLSLRSALEVMKLILTNYIENDYKLYYSKEGAETENSADRYALDLSKYE